MKKYKKGIFIGIIATFCLIIYNIPEFKWMLIDKENYLNSFVKDNNCKFIEENINSYKTNSECQISINYRIISSKYKKNKLFNKLKNYIKNDISIVNYKITNSSGIYTKKEMIIGTGKDYKIAIKDNKSILYISAEINQKNIVNKILSDLGYNNFEIIPLIFGIINFIILFVCIFVLLKKAKIYIKGEFYMIPINLFMFLFKKIYNKWIYLILAFIPYIGVYLLLLIFAYKISEIYNKNLLLCICTFILPSLFIPIFAFEETEKIPMNINI